MWKNLTFKKVIKDLSIGFLWILWGAFAFFWVCGMPVYIIGAQMDGQTTLGWTLFTVWVVVLIIILYLGEHSQDD